MIKQEETPNPLNPNAEVLEYKDGRFIPKQPSSGIAKSDPIWEFFKTDEGILDPLT